MLSIPAFLGIIKPAGTPGPPPSANLLELDNPNAFTVSVGKVGEFVQNTESIGTGDIESPGLDGGGNTNITFV